ncbi:hypothetical protein [Haliangium sp.]|uniref:hypothetical protein n=1 Tax=Haliangium sp. TaxID=2663208 RepID=UPI003D0C8A11
MVKERLMMDDETNKSLLGLMSKGVATYYSGVKHSVDSVKHSVHSATSFLESAVFPAIESMVRMNEQVAQSVVSALQGDKQWRDVFEETSQRFDAGRRFNTLVHTIGKELFGSARFEGEVVLAEDEMFRLTYIPASAPAVQIDGAPAAMFHAGGIIPFSDRIFRMLPAYNFYDRFRERGIAVYAMELRGDRAQVDYSGLTIDSLVDAIALMSTRAFEHNRGRKLILEGYCGQGTQALTYVAAKPDDAEAKFRTVCTFVSPVDGSRCASLARSVQATPDLYHEALMGYYGALMDLSGGGYLSGEGTQFGLDLPLGSLFGKSWLGYFSTGWNRTDLARVQSADDLSETQKRDLTGAYWVSTDCARRFPLPVGIARFTSALFRDGVARDGTLPYPVQGREVNLRAIVEQTTLPVIGVYGGRDPVVPDSTAHVMLSVLGDRYRHVVHPQAGHISYVLSPKLWKPGASNALAPNPIDLILASAGA